MRNAGKAITANAYDSWAPIYDLVFGPVFQRGRAAAVEAAERAGGSVLEVGVGTGLSLASYSGGTRLTGVDISSPMLRKAQNRVAKLRLGQVRGLAVMDAEKLAFADVCFDVVVAQYVVTVRRRRQARRRGGSRHPAAVRRPGVASDGRHGSAIERDRHPAAARPGPLGYRLGAAARSVSDVVEWLNEWRPQLRRLLVAGGMVSSG